MTGGRSSTAAAIDRFGSRTHRTADDVALHLEAVRLPWCPHHEGAMPRRRRRGKKPSRVGAVRKSMRRGISWILLTATTQLSAVFELGRACRRSRSRAKSAYSRATCSGVDGPSGRYHCGSDVHIVEIARPAWRGCRTPNSPVATPASITLSSVCWSSLRDFVIRARFAASRLRISLAPMKASSRR